MKIGICGGGPAGLYFALLMKKSNPAHAITVVEQNPADATYGWGVVTSCEAMSVAGGSVSVRWTQRMRTSALRRRNLRGDFADGTARGWRYYIRTIKLADLLPRLAH